VRDKAFKIKIPLLVFSVFLFSTLALAQDSDIVKIQGRVMQLDLEKKVMIVNERLFMLDSQTTVRDEKDYRTTVDRLKLQAWVYVEGENNKTIKKLVATKIYLLPKYVERKERHLYPFMN
jgi:hypothetical protein